MTIRFAGARSFSGLWFVREPTRPGLHGDESRAGDELAAYYKEYCAK